jgi:hypothetical protein
MKFRDSINYIRTHVVRAQLSKQQASIGWRKSRITSGQIVIFSQHLRPKIGEALCLRLTVWDASTCEKYDIKLKKFTIKFNAMPLFDFLLSSWEHKSMHAPAPDTHSVSVSHWRRDSFQAAVLGY